MPTAGIQEKELRNGLRVLVREMHQLPVVCTLLCYRVGARDEGRGETGLSHFLEHMMFKGTRRFGKGRIDAITARLGGYNNAMTSEDATCYLFRVAADRWPRVLEIEADRMQGCLLDPQEFEQERKVVLEELRMGRDEPWYRLFQEIQAAAFQVHPYRQPIIGWEDDLRRLTRDRMQAFYRRHYSPERATLVVVGAVAAADVCRRAEAAFGALPASGEERPPAPVEPPPAGPRRVQTRAPGTVPRLALAWPALSLADPREPALDLLAVLLGGGRTSRLYRRLVKGEELAASVAVYNESRLDPGLFWVAAELKEGVDPARVEAVVQEEIDRLARRPPPATELARTRARVETALHFGREETYGVAMRIGEYETNAGLAAMARYPARIAAVRPEELRDLARELLAPDRLVTGVSLPAGGPGDGRRGGRPPAPPRRCGRRGARRFPPIRRAELDNGLKVLAVRLRAAPVVSVLCRIEAGQELESREKAGLGALVGACLAEGTVRRGGEALAEAVEGRGGSLGTGAEGVAVRMHARDLAAAVAVTAEVVRTPSFPREAVERIKKITASEIAAELEHPRAAAELRFREVVYDGHPLALPPRGFPRSVSELRRADLAAWHRRWFTPDRATVAVAGDVDPAAVLGEVERRFGGWRGPASRPPSLPPLVRRPGRREEQLPMAREQLHLFLGHLGVARTDPDYYALLVMDHILGTGPGFTDRISRRLRDEQGLAYAVSAGITPTADRWPGCFQAYIGTSPENRQAAVAGFLAEIDGILARPPAPGEVAAVADYLTGSFYLGLERSARVVRFLTTIERHGLGLDFLDRYPDLVRAVGPAQVHLAARRHLFPADLVLVGAGPQTGGGR